MNKEESIFRVEVNEKGIQSILKINRIVTVLFWSGIFINSTMVFYTLQSYFKYNVALKTIFSLIGLRFLMQIFYILFFSVSYFFQFFYFLKFARQSKKSLQINESDAFNKSLIWLYRAFCMTAIGIGLNGLYALYTIFGNKIL